jgi:hypothetical protein
MKLYILLLAIMTIGLQATGQTQAETYIREAQGYLAQKDYKQAQMSLQDAINDLNNMIATQVAESLPTEINGLKASGENSINNGAMGMMGGGMHITKTYQHPTRSENQADVVIMANSPLMSMMSMYLNNPAMMGQGAKSCRVGTTRAVIKTEMTDDYDDNGGSKKIRSSELQIPLSQTLITITMRGFATEAEELAFASKLDIDKLRTALGE